MQEARQESKVAEGTSDLSSAKRRVVKKNVGPVTQLPNPPRHQIEEMASTSQTIYTIQELLAAGVDTGRNQEGDHFAGNEGDDFGGMERGEIILNNAMSQAPPQRVEEMNRTVGDQGTQDNKGIIFIFICECRSFIHKCNILTLINLKTKQ